MAGGLVDHMAGAQGGRKTRMKLGQGIRWGSFKTRKFFVRNRSNYLAFLLSLKTFLSLSSLCAVIKNSFLSKDQAFM